MNQISDAKIYGTQQRQVVRVICLNFAVALALGLTFWMFQNKPIRYSIFDEIVGSLIHAAIYGLSFGAAMPYLGERLSNIRPPWNWVSIIGSLFLIAVFSTLLVQLSLLEIGYLSVGDFRQEFVFKSLGVFLIALVIGLGIYAYENFRDHIQATNLQLRTQELEKERALKLASEARLASLESRLHPHFLFNTLNSISALISEDPQAADEMVRRLATLLRTSLDACGRNRATLGEEIELVKNYLEIEKTRFRERLRYSIDAPPETISIEVPPLILQPLVENSIKFAVAPKPSGGSIKISARRDENDLLLEVWDDGAGFSPEMIPAGHGLDNLQSRLKTLFGEKADLSIDLQNGGTTVSVIIPLDGYQ